MGRKPKNRPKRLSEKLKLIRLGLGIKTYEEMVARLKSVDVNLYPSSIYKFESGDREPDLVVLLKYAKLAGISTDDLIDDSVELSPELRVKKVI